MLGDGDPGAGSYAERDVELRAMLEQLQDDLETACAMLDRLIDDLTGDTGPPAR